MPALSDSIYLLFHTTCGNVFVVLYGVIFKTVEVRRRSDFITVRGRERERVCVCIFTASSFVFSDYLLYVVAAH